MVRQSAGYTYVVVAALIVKCRKSCYGCVFSDCYRIEGDHMMNFCQKQKEMIKKVFVLAVILSINLMMTPVNTLAAEPQGRKNILVLNAYHDGLSWTAGESNGIVDVLKSSGQDMMIYVEFMDWKNYPSQENIQHLVNYLDYKYRDVKLDVVITSDDAALEFALNNRGRLFSNAPVVFCGVNQIGAEALTKNFRDVTGVLEEIDPEGTMDLALKVNPALKKVYVVYDNTESGISTGEMTINAVKKVAPKLSIVPLNRLTHEQLFETIKKAENDSIILMTTYYVDINGIPYDFDEFCREASKVTKVPIFHLYDFGLNNGAIGGSLVSGKLQGENAGRMALRVLGGENINDIPFSSQRTLRKVLDYNEITRFGLPLKGIETNTEIINKPFSFFETYKREAIIVVTGFLMLTIFLFILLFYLRKLSISQERLKLSEERFRLATQGSNDIIWDEDYIKNEYFFSDKFYEIFGQPTELNSFEYWKSRLHPYDLAVASEARQEHFAGRRPIYSCEYRLKDKNGEYRWFYARGKALFDAAGTPIRFAGSLTDITERKENELNLHMSYQQLEATYEELSATEEELQQQYSQLQENQEELRISEERFRIAMEASNEVIWDHDPNENTIFHSDKWFELLGFPKQKDYTMGEILSKLYHPDDVGKMYQAIHNHFEGKTPVYNCEIRLKTAQGGYKWFLTRGKVLRDGQGKIIKFIGTSTDITETKEYQNKLQQMAYSDALTNLPNRLYLSDKLAKAVKDESVERIAIFFIDTDNFKYINDSLGHSEGDQLLVRIGERLRKVIGISGEIVRFGGDEFVVFIKNINDHETYLIAKDLVNAFKQPFYINHSQVHVSISLGISIYPDHGFGVDELLKHADIAMYKAKDSGKGRFVAFDEDMDFELINRINIDQHLRNALANDEFLLHYQPQIDIHNNCIYGFEALVRWNSPELGMVSPNQFIKVAEDTQIIIPLGEWILRTACGFVKKLHVMGHNTLVISVNVSILQLLQEDFVSIVMRAINDFTLDPESLELEITESILMETYEDINEKLERLRNHGVRISLDDFGKGYSSLSYLRQLPIDVLKIDKSFIDSVTEEVKKTITGSIVHIGHEMGLTVVAEGVETKEQLEYLKKYNCDRVQGYYFSKPVAGTDVITMLEQK